MNKIQQSIKKVEKQNFPFKPDRDFYRRVNINQKRWGLIVKGHLSPTIDETKAIAEFFEVEVSELI
jgi:hypothetical protein